MMTLATVTRDELRRILRTWPVFSVMILAALIYAAFYPQPYVHEAVRRVPIVVVDQDGTTAARTLIRRVDASSDVSVAAVEPDLATAQAAIFRRQASGILLIPRDFERELLHGRASPVSLYADSGYFLIYQRVTGAVGAAARTLGGEIEIARLTAAGIDPSVGPVVSDPLPFVAVPLFNPQGGYATYVLPAALTLILQQLLLIAVGLLGTLPGADAPPPEGGHTGRWRLAVTIVTGKLAAYLTVEAVIIPAYLLILPAVYGLPRLGDPVMILLVTLPFAIAVAALGMVVAAICRSAIAVQLVTATLGLPFFFLAGFGWPAEAMPAAIRLAASAIPSTPAIDAVVRVSQMGASLAEIGGDYRTLCGLASTYVLLAVLLKVRSLARSSDGPAKAPLPCDKVNHPAPGLL